jgi:hypothetical protein
MNSQIIERFRTEAPEKCIRSLLTKYTKVWVNCVFETKGKVKLQHSYIADVPLYRDTRAKTRASLSGWDKYGGIVLQSFTDSLYNRIPPVPALMLMECPFSLEKLGIASLPAYSALVVRVPMTWRLHEMMIANRFPGKLACQEFHEYLLGQHQRMSDYEAEVAQFMGHDLNDIAVISAEQYSRYEYYGRALDILPETLAPSVWPVKIISEPPPYSPALPTWRIIMDRAPEVGGYRLVAKHMFDDMPFIHWKTHLGLMRRYGVVHCAPQLSFLSVKKIPDFERAEQRQQSALHHLREVTELVESWPMYPIDKVRGPVKQRRTQSPRRRAALRDAGLLPDIYD